MKPFSYLSIFLAASAAQVQAQAPGRPHIVLIMCDDMGFSDLGCYGSEINTPHIDSLARAGVRFTQFKNTGRSCPSRASLLTGRYQHTVGMGWMTAVDEHRPGYRGQITDTVPTISEVMRSNGYRTYMSGKWHVTLDEHFDRPDGSYPTQRGFDEYYGCLSGGGSYYTPTPVYRNLTRITDFPEDYYYTTAITDSATAFIRRHSADEPMFLYVAHYAPHIPLQAPQDRVNKCLPRYRVGYDVLRQQRFERQKELGLFPDTLELPIYDKEFSVTDASVVERIYSAFGQEPWYCIRVGKVGFSGDILEDAFEYYNSIVNKQQRMIERAFQKIFEHWYEVANASNDYSVQPLKYVRNANVPDNI